MRLRYYLSLASALFLTIALLDTPATAVVKHTNIPDTVLKTPMQSINLDIDANGIVDFVLFYDEYQDEPFLHINVPVSSQATNKVVVTGEQNGFGKDIIAGLPAGSIITDTTTFSGPISGNGPLLAQPESGGEDILEGRGPVYVGIRFARAANIHYGWLRIEVNAAGDQATLSEIAWEDVRNTAIVTGIAIVVPVTKINVTASNGADVISTAGGTLQLVAEVLPSNASDKRIVWSVSDTSIASISQEGLLTARANGFVTATATAQDASGVTGTMVIGITGQTSGVEETASALREVRIVDGHLLLEFEQYVATVQAFDLHGRSLLDKQIVPGTSISIPVDALRGGQVFLYLGDAVRPIKLIVP